VGASVASMLPRMNDVNRWLTPGTCPMTLLISLGGPKRRKSAAPTAERFLTRKFC
jgi:hypothetical protein